MDERHRTHEWFDVGKGSGTDERVCCTVPYRAYCNTPTLVRVPKWFDLREPLSICNKSVAREWLDVHARQARGSVPSLLAKTRGSTLNTLSEPR